jgi:hypothetical protein
MIFGDKITLDEDAFLSALGCEGEKITELFSGDAAVRYRHVVEETCAAATPRWTCAGFGLDRSDGLRIDGTGLLLEGKDIDRHLARCDRILVLAVTLGAQVDAYLRRMGAVDAADAVIADAAASTLAEQYANAAERMLRDDAEARGRYVTRRFSPGYGDLDIRIQNDLIRLTDAARQIGLTANESHLLLPRKSITALLGEAAEPVSGRLAGCKNCALFEGCERRKRGGSCG